AAGTEHVCAIRRDRSLQCWGATGNGQTHAPAGRFVAVDAGSFHTCALRPDGTAACWGQDNFGQATAPVGSFVKVTAAREHSCGVTVDGAVRCFGRADGNRTVGLPGGSVRVGLRYPVTGPAVFEWSSVIAENSTFQVEDPSGAITLPPAPRFRIPDEVWSTLSASARGREFAFSIQRHTGDRLLDVVQRVARFSESPLTGKITYQSYGTRTVLNSIGTYEDAAESWGAAVFAYDTKTRRSTVVAGSNSDSSAAGCRGCHAIGAHSGLLLTGLDNRVDAALLAPGEPAPDERLVSSTAGEHGGALWAAVHPTLPVALSSRGPTPCAEASTDSGSCLASMFTSAAGELAGQPYAIQTAPGAMVGAAWFDSDGDGAYDSSSQNRFLDLGPGTEGSSVGSNPPRALRAAMPVFSPEGDRVAFVHYAGELRDGVGEVHAGDRRSLGMMDFDP